MAETNLLIRTLASPDATAALARDVALCLRGGDVVALWGDLGAGKSCFARALIRALNERDESVPSPTFTLAQAYDTPRGRIWHFDLYRLEAPEELFELGWDDALDDIMLVEWPERAGRFLPQRRLDVELRITGTQTREARLRGSQEWTGRLRAPGHG